MGSLTAGSTYALILEGDADGAFPAGAAYWGEIRAGLGEREAIGVLSSAGGTVIRESGRRLRIVIQGEVSRDWRRGEIVFDLWRVDLPDPMIWTATIAVPVERPATPRPETTP